MQVQSARRTVAGVLEAAFSRLLREPIKLTSAGRTDTGVHACGQVVSFKTQAAFPFERLAIAANSVLPHDVRVREAAIVADDFSARFSALERTYVYAILNRAASSALLAHRAWHVWKEIDLDRFEAAAQTLVGEHDFRSFCGTLPERGPTTRTVRALNVRRIGEIVRMEIRADGFLHRMVRTIAGTLVDCATGRRDPAQMAQTLAARDRGAAGTTAPAHGLYLAGVRYRDGFDSFAEPPVTAAFAAP